MVVESPAEILENALESHVVGIDEAQFLMQRSSKYASDWLIWANA